ncbi:hypothetical protein M513_06447 [Trichuris suis]|uniref:Uncharacterized protein n=1 Tax=Trichuris suis TaxID=68888 RepID=A0A085M5V4_9BILA|nr:hypothetical protein M513_06447 [Trichuris suis]
MNISEEERCKEVNAGKNCSSDYGKARSKDTDRWFRYYERYYNWEDKELRTVTAGKREAHLLVRRHRAVAGGNKKFDSKDLAEEFAAINCGIWTLVKMDANRKGQSTTFSNTNTEEDEVAEILDTLKQLSISDECNKTCIDMWLACNNEAGFHILNDDEIIAAVSNLHREPDEEEE